MAQTWEQTKQQARAQGKKTFTYGGQTYSVEQTFQTPEEETRSLQSMGIPWPPQGEVNAPAQPEPAYVASGIAPPLAPGMGFTREGWPPNYTLPVDQIDVTATPERKVQAWSANLFDPRTVQQGPMAERTVVEPTWQGAAQAEQFPLTGVGGTPAPQASGWPPPTASVPGGAMNPMLMGAGDVARSPGGQAWIAPQEPQAQGNPFAALTAGGSVTQPPLAPGVTPGAGAPVAPGDVGGAAAAQLPPEVAPGPPRTPEEFQQRRASWQQFLSRTLTDPNLSLMWLKMGTMMAQPVPVNQNPAGHLANAVQGGVDYQRMVNQQSEENLRRNAAVEEASRRTDAYVESSAAQTAATRQATREAMRAENLTYDTLSARLTGLKTANELATLERDVLKWKNRPERLTMLDEQEKRELALREKALEASLAAAKAQMIRAQKEPSTMELARLQAAIKSQAARAFVASVDTQVAKYREDEAKRGRTLSEAEAQNEFFSNYGNLAQEYFKAQSEASIQTPGGWGQGVTGAPGGPPTGTEAIAGPTDAEVARAQTDPNLRVEIIRGPDGRLIRKIVPARPVQVPGAGAAGAAPAPPPVPMVPYR